VDAEFHELKANVKTSREMKEGKEDKFMMLISRNKTKKVEKVHFNFYYEKNYHVH
jgi:hypothetical protein